MSETFKLAPRANKGNLIQRAFLVKEIGEWECRVGNPSIEALRYHNRRVAELNFLKSSQFLRVTGVAAEVVGLAAFWFANVH